MSELTKRQSEILGLIRTSIRERGFPPTVREIGESTRILSPNGVMCHLKALEKKGYIERDGHISRGIHLAGFAKVAVEVGGLRAVIEIDEAVCDVDLVEFANDLEKLKSEISAAVVKSIRKRGGNGTHT